MNKYIFSFIALFALFSNPLLTAQDTLPEEYLPISRNQIIKKGAMEMVVQKYRPAKNSLDSIVRHWQGYIAYENEGNFRARITNTLTIRVPNANFDQLVSDIGALAKKVKTKTIKIVDTEKEYNDLTKRIETKLEVKKRYNELVSKAKINSEITEAKEQIEKINSEIEQLENQIAYLKDGNYSTLNLEMYQAFNTNTQPTNTSGQLDFSKQGIENIIRNFLIFTLPVGLIVLAIFLYKRFKKSKKRKRRSKSSSAW